jgi:hypothetical protein
LTLAHQYLEQAKPTVRQAVFGNAGSFITFRVGGPDGVVLEQLFASDMQRTHFQHLKKHEVIASIPDQGAAPIPFRGMTLAPQEYPAGRRSAIIALSRERFGLPRATVEPRITALFADVEKGKSPP